MLAPSPAAAATLNFVVAGAVRSGTGALASALANSGAVCCHLDLLHESEAVRRAGHLAYFGAAEDGAPGHLTAGGNPQQYLEHHVFDRPRHDERAVGLRISYAQLHALDLADLLAARCRLGDFCAIHVLRNPIACFVSLRQALYTGRWCRGINDAPGMPPPPITVDPDTLAGFVRMQLAVRGRVADYCRDRYEVHYKDLVLDFAGTMDGIYEFLQVAAPSRHQTDYLRMRNWSLHDRILSLDRLRARLPRDVDALFDLDDIA